MLSFGIPSFSQEADNGLNRDKTNGQFKREAKPRVSSRSKRDEIIVRAVERFAQEGYEDTKWADVAADVGIGSTALYHYFESKLHCLYVIMADGLESFQRDFEQIAARKDAYAGARRRTPLGLPTERTRGAADACAGCRAGPGGRAAEVAARGRGQRVWLGSVRATSEFSWAAFLVRGMEHGVLPRPTHDCSHGRPSG